MDKIKLRGGLNDGLKLQLDTSSSRMYVDGQLYVWNKHIERSGYKIFEWNEVVTLVEDDYKMTKAEIQQYYGWEDDGGKCV